jgi:hypothetical protein
MDSMHQSFVELVLDCFVTFSESFPFFHPKAQQCFQVQQVVVFFKLFFLSKLLEKRKRQIMSKLYLCFVVCMIAVLAVKSAPLKVE